MKLVALEGFRNLKLRHKVVIVFVILMALVVNLAIVNISAVRDVSRDTEHLANTVIPRLLAAGDIKDNLNAAVVSANRYVETGNRDFRSNYEQDIRAAVAAQVVLFQLAQTETDLQFVSSFQDQINGVYAALSNFITAYESNDSAIDSYRVQVEIANAGFTSFLESNVNAVTAAEAVAAQTTTTDLVSRTLGIVVIIGGIALFLGVILYWFIQQSVTRPIEKLTTTAHAIASGFFQSVDITSKDELGLFADTFNRMITTIKSTQDSLQAELEKTKKLDAQKSEFLSVAAHQLRTPMSGINWMVNMMIDGDLGKISAEAKEQLGKGKENIGRMIVLINNLLDVAQMDTNELTFEFTPVDVNQVIKDAIAEVDGLAHERTVSINFDSATGLQVPADAEKLRMAIRNVIDNAVRYTPQAGSVTISLAKKDTTVQIQITDTGYGIPPEEADDIFTKFTRGSNIQIHEADGSGLGLYITKKIIDEHSGDISFESELDKGTTFTITLPQALTS